MKTYNQFIVENVQYLNVDIKNNFEFIIDVKNATQEQLDAAFAEFEKYTELDAWVKKYLVSKDNGGKVWAWRINITRGWGGRNKSYFTFNIITTPNWGVDQGMNIMDDRLTIQEFINVGLLGSEKLVNFKRDNRIMMRDANKYNI